MGANDNELRARLEMGLASFAAEELALPGIASPTAARVLIDQMIESIHRVRFPITIGARHISPRRADPHDELFDPIRAAALHKRTGNSEEAFWLVFLFVHFGKHSRGGWRYLTDFYGMLGSGLWSWSVVSEAIGDVQGWLADNAPTIALKDRPGGFGNHRKYESLSTTGDVIASYVSWVAPPRTQVAIMQSAIERAGRERAFDMIYKAMSSVKRFGRTARFDYLSMIGKLELAQITPASAYLTGSGGPTRGAQLLFGNGPTAPVGIKQLDEALIALNTRLGIGMQALEDSICNWQKSPTAFVAFRG